MQNVFVYGTLMSRKLIKKLTGRVFTTSTASLTGYKRYCVKSRAYPAIVKNPTTTTYGLLVEDVDLNSLKLITFYEGNEYKPEEVLVYSNGKHKKALVFVWAVDKNFLEDREWDFKNFEENGLQDYLNFDFS